MINIRLVLNDNLWQFGGHIGYNIRPSERKNGYGKINLYLALKFCQSRGIKAVLLDCDKTNLGSAKTIQALGGKLIREHPHRNASGETITVQQYVIDVDNAINRNIVEYDQFVSEYPR